MVICPHCQTVVDQLYAPCPTGDGYYGIDEQEHLSFKKDPFLGRCIGERFVVSAVIGHGSIGRVYKGHQLNIKRDVVLKIFKLEHFVDEQRQGEMGYTMEEAEDDARARFIREAHVLGQLTHPNCVTIYDFGAGRDGSFLYIAMEFVAGMSMRKAVKRGLRYDAMIDIMRQILMALREAHMHGIIHRDLKPENIMLSFRRESSEPVVKVLDFGIAKLLHRDVHTTTGMLFGTPAYMSPEQCRGESDRVGPYSDIYSLGCMFYELVCGRLPYPGKSPQQMIFMHTDDPIPEVIARDGIEVSDELAAFIRTCLSKEPSERYGNAKIALEHLDEALGAQPNIKYRATSIKDPTNDGFKVPQAVLEAAAAQAAAASSPPPADVGVTARNVETVVGQVSAPMANPGLTVVAPEFDPEVKAQADRRNLAVGVALVVVLLFCVTLFVFIFKAIMA